MTIREWMTGALSMAPHASRFELELIAGERLNMNRAHLLAHLDDNVEETVLAQLEKDAQALANHQPLQYILGYAYFRDATYVVNENVLIPRFDTEHLVEAVLARVKSSEAEVLDLCTGSGIVAVSLSREHPHWTVCASDLSPKALEVARLNGERLGAKVEWREGDLFSPWEGLRFDAVVSNPPYIERGEYETLAEEIHKEPVMALVAEDEGLIFYKRLAKEAPSFLREDGWLAVEIGYNQGEAVTALFKENHFKEVECLRDDQGHDRVVVGQLS